MTKILFIQQAYAHYRQGLFELLHANYDITFVFLQGRNNYPSGLEPNPDWKMVTLHKEKSRWWMLRLFLLILKNQPDVIVTAVNGSPQTMVAVMAGKLSGIPVVLWSLSWGAPYRSRGKSKIKLLQLNMRKLWTTRKAAAVVAGGSRARAYHRFLDVPNKRIFMAYQSTMDQRLMVKADTPRKDRQNHPDCVNLLYFSRIVESKGLDVLLEAFAEIESRYPEARLIIAGDGPFMPYCKELASRLEVERVSFSGPVANEDAWKHYMQADIFILPCSGKETAEAWGLVINEAASMGLPVITTEAVGAVGDLAKDGVNGVVVKPGDVDQLAGALEKLVSDKEKREKMGQASRRLFEAVNSYRKMYQGFAAAIEYSMAQKRNTK
jgi:glycosyltransferase involved in cell wall biosynthesis